MDPENYVLQIIHNRQAYHDHKERMAYNAATLYIAAFAALGISTPFWKEYQPLVFLMTSLILVFFAATGLFYVSWQLTRRRRAAVVSNACFRVAATWLSTGAPTREDLMPKPVPPGSHLLFPKAVADQVKVAAPILRKELWWPETITLAAMLVMAVGGTFQVALRWNWDLL